MLKNIDDEQRKEDMYVPYHAIRVLVWVVGGSIVASDISSAKHVFLSLLTRRASKL